MINFLRFKSNSQRITFCVAACLLFATLYSSIFFADSLQFFTGFAKQHNSHSHDGNHAAGVDVEQGKFTPEEIAYLESIPPDRNLSSKTPPPFGQFGPGSDQVTVVVDFVSAEQQSTTDIFGNVMGPFDVTDFGFAPDETDMVIEALMAGVRKDYFDDLLLTDIGQQGQQLDINFMVGDVGTPPPGVSEYYFIQVGNGISGPHLNTLGVAGVGLVRNQNGVPNGNADIGDVVASVFASNTSNISQLVPADALTGGDLTFVRNALGGTISHEIGHTLFLRHAAVENSIQPTGAAPVMGTGAIDFNRRLRLTDREFSLSGFNPQFDNVPIFHIADLANSIGLTERPEPEFEIIGRDNFDGYEQFMSRTIVPDLSSSNTPGTFPNSSLDVFGIVNRDVNSLYSDDSLVSLSLEGMFPLTMLDNFLAQADLENANNPSGTGVVVYTFDITGHDNLALSIDIAAMGDFEASTDINSISAIVDGAPQQTLLELLVDESASQTYTFQAGNTETLDDPIRVNGTLLDNSFQNFVAPIQGTGSVLVLTISCQGNDGLETIAFNNLLIISENGVLLGDVNCDGVVTLLDVGPFVDAITSSEFNPKADINGDGTDDLLDVGPFVSLLDGG